MSSANNEPLQPTNNNRSNKTAVAGSKPTVTFKPMSRLPLSAELEQYAQSMKSYLASVESRPNDRRPSDSEESDPDRAPEFCWMDLAAVRRRYSHQSVSVDGTRRVVKSSSSSSGMISATPRNNGARQHLPLDNRPQPRQHHPALQHLDIRRSASPSRNSSSPIKKHHQTPLQPRVRVKVSTEKN